MDTQTQSSSKAYQTPVLAPEGSVTNRTHGTEPVLPKEADDLQGFGEDV